MTWDRPHHLHILEALERLTSGDTDRMMIFVPPRHGKTTLVTERYTAWVLEQQPETSVILAAYNQTLAEKFSRRIRNIVRERVTLNRERFAVTDWETEQGGGVRAAGVGGGITGMGGELIVIDDPIRGREEADSPAYRERVWDWYTDDLYTRREPGAKMILILTRWHQDDLAGRILRSEDGPNWEVVHIPAIAMDDDPLEREPGEALWPERVPVADIENYRKFNERGYWSLYQGMPQPEGGAIFLRDWWDGVNRYDINDQTIKNLVVGRYMLVDTAEETHENAAYTSCLTLEVMPDYTVHVRDVYRARLSIPELQPMVERHAKRWNRDGKLRQVRIEYASSGRGVVQNIRASSPAWLQKLVQEYRPRVSKVDRAKQVTIFCANNMVKLPWPDEAAPWLHDFESELFAFPQSAQADQVDCFSMGLIGLRRYLLQVLRSQGYTGGVDDVAA